MLGFLSEKPALIASGINPAGNVAHDLTYSGTVAAAMEGAIHSTPSIAVSVDGDHDSQMDFAPAGEYARRIAHRVLADGLPTDTLLNVNVPALPLDHIRGVRVTRLGLRRGHGHWLSGSGICLDHAGPPRHDEPRTDRDFEGLGDHIVRKQPTGVGEHKESGYDNI
jgi:broad specificity polyphosphatase/5'/3'-nucleotidase SurE